MPLSETDELNLKAWLAGNLTPEESNRIEERMGQHPGPMDEIPMEYEASLYHGLEKEIDSEIMDLVARVKSGLFCEAMAPGRDAWKEVLGPTDRDDILGTLGDYEITEVIATGGMAIVLKGYAPELKRHAALKVLAPEMAANATARERFLREARAAARLEHENVLPVYGVYDDTIPWFAMRYVAGETLQERLDRNVSFSAGQLKSIALQMTAALEAAHECGIIHRDIKPANVLFDGESDRLWVCDFGIARCSDDPSLTYPGAIAGTPRFMSPEQARGEELDGRSDLFSLGAVLHCAATGQHPFAGETTIAVLRDIVNNRPAPLKKPGSKLPLWFRRLTGNLLAKAREDRPANASEVIDQLESESARCSTEAVRRLRRVGWTALGIASVVVLLPALLRLSTVRELVNRGLASRLERAYFIEGRLGAWPGFREVVRAAKNGDVIALPGGYPVTVDGIELPPGQTLTLVASSPEIRPVITKVIASNPGLRVRSHLRLVGIDAVVNASDRGQALFLAEGGRIEFEDCRFRAEVSGSGTHPATLEAAVEMRNGASLLVENSDFELPHANAFEIGGGSSRITIRNSRLSAGRIFRILGNNEVPDEIEMKIEASEFSGDLFFLSESSDSVPLLTVEAKDGQFTFEDALCWFQTGSLEPIEERVRWNGQGNRHLSGGAWIKVDDNPHRQLPLFLFSVDRLSDSFRAPPAGTVELVETGETFHTLKEALNAAAGSATLLLRGRIECPEVVFSKRGQPVQLLAAPNAKPVIVATHRREHALFLRGPTRISRIQFERPYVDGRSYPIVGILAREGSVLIEDCVFTQTSAEGSDTRASMALGITGTKLAEIRRCLFRGGSALWLAFIDDENKREEVRIEDSVFENAFGLRFHSRLPGCEYVVRMDRCVGLLDELLEMVDGSEIMSGRIELRDCLMDMENSDSSGGKAAITPFLERIEWTGMGNIFRADNPETTPGRPGSEVGDHLQDRLRTIGRMTQAPFDRSKLTESADPVSMIGALSDEAMPSAAATLEHFIEGVE